MKPIQKQTGEIKLNRENPQFGYFLSFARRECSKSTRLHPSQMRKATKQPDCTVPKCGRQQNNRIVPFPNAEGSKTTGLHRSQMRKATKQADCTVPKCGRQQNKRIALFPNAEGPETIKLAKAKIKYNLNF